MNPKPKPRRVRCRCGCRAALASLLDMLQDTAWGPSQWPVVDAARRAIKERKQ